MPCKLRLHADAHVCTRQDLPHLRLIACERGLIGKRIRRRCWPLLLGLEPGDGPRTDGERSPSASTASTPPRPSAVNGGRSEGAVAEDASGEPSCSDRGAAFSSEGGREAAGPSKIEFEDRAGLNGDDGSCHAAEEEESRMYEVWHKAPHRDRGVVDVDVKR